MRAIKEMTRKIRSLARRDKRAHQAHSFEWAQNTRAQWKALKDIKTGHTRKLYARTDATGRFIPHAQQAEATARQLAEKQWGNSDGEQPEQPRPQDEIESMYLHDSARERAAGQTAQSNGDILVNPPRPHW